MKWLPFIFLAATTTAAPLIAQNPPAPEGTTCETGTAESYLDANYVKAMILNTGGLYWNGSDPVYEVPKGSGVNAVFTSAFWVGGMVDGELRMSASRYGPWEMWPGPLGATPEQCAEYDRIFEINTLDLDEWHETGQPTLNMIEWPWHLGAPVTDGDGIAGNYNLAGGDLPELLGDETLWWIMNDAGGEHRD